MTLDHDTWRYSAAEGPRLFKAGDDIPAGWCESPQEAGIEVSYDDMGNESWSPVGELEHIPADYADLKWFALKALASRFTSGDPPLNKAQALELIQAELKRRGD